MEISTSTLGALKQLASGAAVGAATGGPAGAIIAAVAPTYGLIQSYRQRQLAKEIEDQNKEPKFTANPYLTNNLDLALAEYANKGLPGQEKIREGFDQSQAAGFNAARTLTNSTDFSNAVSGITESRIAQETQLGIAGANKDAQDLQVLMGANQAKGEDFLRGEDQKMQRYLRAAATASAYRGAANIGTQNAINDISTLGILANGKGGMSIEQMKLILGKK